MNQTQIDLKHEAGRAESRLVVLRNLLDNKRRPIILALLGFKMKQIICPICGSVIKGRLKSKYIDKNFKPIRTEDIIKTPAGNRFLVDRLFKNLEYWIHGRGAYCLCDCWLEVIGNIYDNPKMKYSKGHGDPLEKS